MADEYPVLKDLETKLILQWVDVEDVMATQRAIIQVEPAGAYLELPRGRRGPKGNKGDRGPGLQFQGIVKSFKDLPSTLNQSNMGWAWVNTSTKELHIWNGTSWIHVPNVAAVEADLQTISQWVDNAEVAATSAAAAANTATQAIAGAQGQADRAKTEADRAEAAAKETIAQVTGDFATRNYVDTAKWGRPRLPNAAKIDSYTFEQHRGAYPVWSKNDATSVGLPLPNEGVFTVHWLAGVVTPVTIQVWEPRTGERFVRFLPAGGTWSEWRSKADEGKWSRGILDGSTPLDEIKYEKDEGVWRVLSESTSDLLGLSETSPGKLEVQWIAGSNTPYAIQIWRPVMGIDTWERRNNAYGWSAWRSKADEGSNTEGAVELTAESRREQLIASRGGRIGTGGKGAVAFRFDHNVAPFQAKVLPLLEGRGLPASMAHFANEMTPDSSYAGSNEKGKTWADVTAQFFKGVEVWSHSYTHTDPADYDTLVKEIVQSRTDLEARIPEASVVGWMQPGLTGGKYGGYGDVFNAPEYHGTTRAGRLIASTYGADDRSGVTHTPLGQRNFGCLWIDTANSALAVNNAIDEAARTGIGVVIALHPSMVDASNGISTTTLTAILDHVAALRDAGEIEVLTVGGLTLVDPGSSWRQNLAPALAQWRGWDSGETRTGTPSSGTLSTSFSLGNHPYLAGHLREAQIKVSGTGEMKVRIKDRTGVSALDISRTFAVNSERTLHVPFGIARNNNGLSVELTCASGSVTVTAAKIISI